MGQKVRRRPFVESIQKDVKRDEHQLCNAPGCRNVIATWSKYKTCSLCRGWR